MLLVWVTPLKATGPPERLSSYVHPQGLLGALSAHREERSQCPGWVAAEGGMQGISSPWGRPQGDHFCPLSGQCQLLSHWESFLVGSSCTTAEPAKQRTLGFPYLEHSTVSPPLPKKFLGMLYRPMHESSTSPAFISVHLQHQFGQEIELSPLHLSPAAMQDAPYIHEDVSRPSGCSLPSLFAFFQ